MNLNFQNFVNSFWSAIIFFYQKKKIKNRILKTALRAGCFLIKFTNDTQHLDDVLKVFKSKLLSSFDQEILDWFDYIIRFLSDEESAQFFELILKNCLITEDLLYLESSILTFRYFIKFASRQNLEIFFSLSIQFLTHVFECSLPTLKDYQYSPETNFPLPIFGALTTLITIMIKRNQSMGTQLFSHVLPFLTHPHDSFRNEVVILFCELIEKNCFDQDAIQLYIEKLPFLLESTSLAASRQSIVASINTLIDKFQSIFSQNYSLIFNPLVKWWNESFSFS